MFTYEAWYEMWESDLIQEINEDNIIDVDEFLENAFYASSLEGKCLDYTDLP
jgi:hypothetical protein